jgi:uncharacterized surface protein with fasciclin (FAS1) repeats
MKRILVLFLLFALACVSCTTMGGKTGPDVLDTASAAGNFETLIKACDAAGLTETLKGKGPFTVFAPTDAAFTKFGMARVEDLLKPENRSKLETFLKFHVVPGQISTKSLVKMKSAKTLLGEDLTVWEKYGGIYVDRAMVIKPDIKTSNGIIHGVDAVLLSQSL